MTSIVVLGTGAAQRDLIVACKERGMKVIACSNRTNDLGEKYADIFRKIDISNCDEIYAFAKEKGVDLVYSIGSDIAMPVIYDVSNRLGTKCFWESNVGMICNNKGMLRSTLGIEFKWNIAYQEINNPNDKILLDYPFMLKPIDSQGQRGVFLINSREDFLSKIDNSLSFSSKGKAIIEQYIPGKEISVNVFCSNGEIVFFMPTKRIVWQEHTGGIIHKHIVSKELLNKKELIENIKQMVDDAIHRLGIINGPVYFQIMINENGKPFLIEITPRLDGCHMWRLLLFSTGVDLLSLTIDSLCGKRIDKIINFDVKEYETEFLCLNPDSVFHKKNFKLKQYDYLEWYYADGEVVRRVNGCKEKCGYVIRNINSLEKN